MESRLKVIVGFSGGVDSTAAALILQEAGYEVVGLCFDVLGNPVSDKTKKAADALGIRLIEKSVKELFYEKVIIPFKEAYEIGQTPNPCIICNPLVKFKVLFDAMIEENADFIATGHYAGIKHIDGIYYVEKSKNIKKDQSYMLCRLTQSILSKTIFPLTGYSDKNDIIKMLKEKNMPNFGEKDSQDLCFIPGGNYREYLGNIGAVNKKGNFIDVNGNILGNHSGILNYTLGQRKGLGITFGKPVFVAGIRGCDIVLGTEEDLKQKYVTVNHIVWSGYVPKKGEAVTCKLRYSAHEAECIIKEISESNAVLEFSDVQRAPTPGQSAVFYKNSLVLGGGFIVK